MTVATEIEAVLDNATRVSAEGTVLFLGAGIGIPAPTNLPDGATLSNGILFHLCDGLPRAREAFYGSRHADPNMSPEAALLALDNTARRYGLLHLNSACVRLETLLFAGWLRCGASFLQCLDILRSGLPNAYHNVAARVLERGGLVFTTNFDQHIEHAVAAGHSVPVVDGWPSCPVEPGTLVKIHGSLGPRWHPVGADRLGATLRRVMSPPRDGQRLIRDALTNAAHVLVAGYSFSDHFDITPALDNLPRREPLLVLEHSPHPLRQLRASPMADKLRLVLQGTPFRVATGEAYDIFASRADLVNNGSMGKALHPSQSGKGLVTIPRWKRAQILAELLIFLGHYSRASTLLVDCAPPRNEPHLESVRYEVLRADVLSGERSRSTIQILRRARNRASRAAESTFQQQIVVATAETSLAREHLRHRHRIRARYLYVKLLLRTWSLSRSASSNDERSRASELMDVVANYGSLVFGRRLSSLIRTASRRSREAHGAVAPDVALMRAIDISAPTPIRMKARLLFALETMNLTAARMVLRNSQRIVDIEQAILLARDLGSSHGEMKSRIALVRQLLSNRQVDQAATHAHRLAAASVELPRTRRRLRVGLLLCAWLAELPPTLSSRLAPIAAYTWKAIMNGAEL